jgi:hypothetical protein
MKEASAIPVVRSETRRVKMVFELKKDLTENEVVCEHCHGTGLEIADNVYGIKGDTAHVGVRFPYKHQSLTFCKHCYMGVRQKCPGCGNLCKQPFYCSCGYFDKQKDENWKREKEEQWETAAKIPVNEAWEKYKCLYVDNVDQYVFSPEELDDLIDEYELDVPSLKIYATITKHLYIDASSVIEGACEDLHEDANDCCDIKELQEILDKWCEKQTGTDTFYPSYKVGVIGVVHEAEHE